MRRQESIDRIADESIERDVIVGGYCPHARHLGRFDPDRQWKQGGILWHGWNLPAGVDCQYHMELMELPWYRLLQALVICLFYVINALHA
jgi:hypothetical protein